METLDLLITNFKALKEELQKNSPLHDTVDGFMTGLKALPKGSAERGKFITAHMSHGPFLAALNTHPQGKQMHNMLMGHLNSRANAGFKPGAAKVNVSTTDQHAPMLKKSDEDLENELEKNYLSPLHRWGPSKPVIRGSADTHAGGMIKPSAKPAAAKAPEAPVKAPAAPAKLTGSDKIAAASKEKIHGISEKQGKPHPAKLTGLDRIKAESQKPIEAMDAKVKKDEDMDKGLFGSAEPKKPFVPSFKGHQAALGTGTSTSANGVTTERSFDPLKQQTSQKKYISMPFGKTINNSYSAPVNSSGSAPMAMSIEKNGQWNLHKGDYGMDERGRPLDVGPEISSPKPHAPKFKGSDLKISGGKVMGPGLIQPPAKPPLKKSDEELKKEHIGFKALQGKLEHEGKSEESAGAIAASIGRKKYGAKKMAEMAHKAEGCYKGECSKCHADPCECQSSGVLVDKSEGQKSTHCDGKTCSSTRSAADQHGRTCGCSCQGCNPAVSKMDGGDMSVGGGV